MMSNYYFTKEQLYVEYLAGMELGISPIDSEIKFEAEIATRSTSSNVVNAFWNGVSGTLSLGLMGSFLYPIASTEMRATILGATPQTVCDACGDNAKLFLNNYGWLSERFSDFVQGVASFADTWGIPEEYVSNLFSGENSVSEKVHSSMMPAVNWLKGQADNLACGFNPEEYLGNCRVVNYLGSVSGLTQWVWNNPNTPYAVGFTVAGIALANFVSDSIRAPKSEKYIHTLLSNRYTYILNILEEMKREEYIPPYYGIRYRDGRSTTVSRLAEGILGNESKIYEEIDALELPNMGRIEKLRLVEPIIELANEILEMHEKKQNQGHKIVGFRCVG